MNHKFTNGKEKYYMTQLEALKVAYEELSSMMPDGENDEIFEAAEVIKKMIYTKEKQIQKKSI